MRSEATIEVAAPPQAGWDFISDPSRALHYMAGITRWEVVSDEPSGLGARYRILLRVRSAEVGGLVEVVEHSEPRDLAWTSVTGIDQRGRWRLRERPGGRTKVTFRLSYGVAGAGIFGALAERIAAPTVHDHLARTVRQLKRQVEHEEQRRHAAERRRARVG
jgi:uncharacterized membrane protein